MQLKVKHRNILCANIEKTAEIFFIQDFSCSFCCCEGSNHSCRWLLHKYTPYRGYIADRWSKPKKPCTPYTGYTGG